MSLVTTGSLITYLWADQEAFPLTRLWLKGFLRVSRKGPDVLGITEVWKTGHGWSHSLAGGLA